MATRLPPDASKDGTPADWVVRGLGFATVSIVGGTPHSLLPVRKPVVQVDCWAVKGGSNKPPWGIANGLAETIIAAGYDYTTTPRPLAITANGVTYPPAAVKSAYALTEPRQGFGDAGSYAHFSFDMQFVWTIVSQLPVS